MTIMKSDRAWVHYWANLWLVDQTGVDIVVMYEFVIMLSDFGVDYVCWAVGRAFNTKRHGAQPGTVAYTERNRA